MTMNKEKCHIMFLSNHVEYPTTFMINGVSVVVDSFVELLGVNIDSKLHFMEHINELCKRARSRLAALKRLFY